MKHVLGFVVACAAACGGGGGGGKTSTPIGKAGPGGVPPALFSALYVDGRTFTYKVTIDTSFYDDSDPKADQGGMVHDVTTATMTCRVHGMQNFAKAIAAKLECDGEADTSPAGIYVATAAGVWRLEEFPLDDAAIGKLDAKAMILSAAPTAIQAADDDPSGEGGSGITVEAKLGGWCQTRSLWGGDESGTTLCFAAGKGLVGGGAFFAGGSTKDINFELVP